MRICRRSALAGEGDGQQLKQKEKRVLRAGAAWQWEHIRHDVTDFIRRCEQEAMDLVASAAARAGNAMAHLAHAARDRCRDVATPYFSMQAQDYPPAACGDRASARADAAGVRRSISERAEPDVVRAIKQYIVEHSHEDISLDAIGRMVGS